MTTTYSVGMAQRGQMTVPKALRDRYHLKEGQPLSVVDVGNGFLVVPQESKIDAVCNELRDRLVESGATLEDMLAELREMRERDGRAS
jgi:AbrB family looped-hinge helix DNA binding protein